MPSLICFAFDKLFAFGHRVCLRQISLLRSLAVSVAFGKSHGCAIPVQRLPSATGLLPSATSGEDVSSASFAFGHGCVAFGNIQEVMLLVHRLPSATGVLPSAKSK